jgi:hypothetical protein
MYMHIYGMTGHSLRLFFGGGSGFLNGGNPVISIAYAKTEWLTDRDAT